MKKISFKFSKPQIKIKIIFGIIFAIVITLELFLVYNYLFAPSRAQVADISEALVPSLRIDFGASARAEKWFSEQETYKLPDYFLDTGPGGRENPFAEP